MPDPEEEVAGKKKWVAWWSVSEVEEGFHVATVLSLNRWRTAAGRGGNATEALTAAVRELFRNVVAGGPAETPGTIAAELLTVREALAKSAITAESAETPEAVAAA